MKRFLLIVLLSFPGIGVFSQNITTINSATRVTLFGGAGLATSHNYDVGISAGLDIDKTVFSRLQVGALIFLQKYSLYYDNESNSSRHGTGYTGFTLRHSSNYVFFTPQLRYHLWSKLNFTSWINVYAGVGMLMNGYDSVRKWDYSFDSTSVGRYDSTIDASKNISSMVTRIGVGFAQDIYMGRGNWHFTFKEDAGFLKTDLTKTGDINHQNPMRTPYSPKKIAPGYISFQIGITYFKPKRK